MLSRYAIHRYDQNTPIVGYLNYEDSTDTWSIDALDTDAEAPAVIELMRSMKKWHVDDDIARCFIRDRICPPERQNIADILKRLGLPYYSYKGMLDTMKLRSVANDFICTPM